PARSPPRRHRWPAAGVPANRSPAAWIPSLASASRRSFFHRKTGIEAAVTKADALVYAQLHRNALLHRLDMTDHADGLAAGIKVVQRIQRHLQRLAIQRAEALVEKQRIDAGLVADQIRQCQRQGQADQETLAAR